MTKRILVTLLLLALAVGLYAMTATASGATVRGPTQTPTQTAQPTAQPSQTAKPDTCEVVTAVFLRTCAGTDCAVLDTMTEGERLTILTAGLWAKVTTEDGVTGWLNSKYCKGK